MAKEQLIEEVADVIEDVAVEVQDVAEATRRLNPRNVGFFAIGAGVGLAVGFAIGYKIGDKRLKTKYEKLAEDEISEMRQRFFEKAKAQVAQDKPPINEVIRERYVETGSRYTAEELQAIREANEKFPAEEEEEVVVEESAQVNVFEANEEWNYQYEISQRTKHVPYIIHYDEFQENAPEHDQTVYTYYEVDDVLADTRDTTIEDMDKAIGLGNLGRWGHGSPDPNTVYVRNEELGLDVEIVRDRGSWADTVHGSIRHSANRIRKPKRRFDDDEITG